MNLVSPIAVAGGAGVGALIRWMLGLALDAIFPSIPLGTLVANVIGGFLMGLGAAVIPGGNDGLILAALPALSVGGAVAYVVMLATIMTALAVKRRCLGE